MKETEHQRFLRLIMGSDEEFFEQFLKDLPEDKLQKFMEDNPDFLKD